MILVRMLSAEEFWHTESRNLSKKFVFLDYMDFAERYADYVVAHEKKIDYSGLAPMEKLENDIKLFGDRAWSMPFVPQHPPAQKGV